MSWPRETIISTVPEPITDPTQESLISIQGTIIPLIIHNLYTMSFSNAEYAISS
jgi:hypothetical protein